MAVLKDTQKNSWALLAEWQYFFFPQGGMKRAKAMSVAWGRCLGTTTPHGEEPWEKEPWMIPEHRTQARK